MGEDHQIPLITCEGVFNTYKIPLVDICPSWKSDLVDSKKFIPCMDFFLTLVIKSLWELFNTSRQYIIKRYLFSMVPELLLNKILIKYLDLTRGKHIGLNLILLICIFNLLLFFFSAFIALYEQMNQWVFTGLTGD